MPVDVSKLRLVIYPDPVLREKARPVEQVNDEVRAVVARMLEIMRDEDGIGLAAPQIGLPWRVFVVNIPPADSRVTPPAPTTSAPAAPPTFTDGPRVYINPVLSKPQGAVELFEEGCLSLPDIRGEVIRPPLISVSALDEHGQPFNHDAAGLLARCLQHETDHLDGVLILDRMTQMSRMKTRSAVRDLERAGPRRR